MKALWLLMLAPVLSAETGRDAWLRYAPVDPPVQVPAVVAMSSKSLVMQAAQRELIRGIRGMLGKTLRIETGVLKENAFILTNGGPWEGYSLRTHPRHIEISGQTDTGVLYGTFALLRKIAMGESLDNLNETHAPYSPIRWINHWDNLDGTIERGYGGRSIFWENNAARADLSRVSEYGRLLASLGINVCSINNVNANPRVLTPEFAPQVARIAEAFRPWGVRIAVSVDFGSPKTIGGLDTFDPLDPRVIAWWKNAADQLYRAVPDLAGFVLKADSEGRVGPSAIGRTHADAANVVARALKPHNGLFFYRGFVYDHRMDWRNLKNDRARAAYDNFRDLDGKFDDNVIIQIKHGPIDFQVREPASPLFGALEKTNQAIELQITQEYFGQGRHMVFLVPMWKEALDFDMHSGGDGTPVKALVTGKVFQRPTGGFVGVSNIGLDESWFGNHLSQANLYGFGRLAWDPNLSAQQIADEWSRLTFGNNPQVVSTVTNMLGRSWRTFENYTGPLGLQTLTDIVGTHFGPAVEAAERNGWGQWHRSDERGSGMDRTTTTGTGFIGQYRPKVAAMYESLETCPDELLLFMHHVPYTYKLHSGKTVIQHLYDTHYAGADDVASMVREWQSLKDHIDDRRYEEVLAQLEYQTGAAQLWRDAITSWFAKTSGIQDAHGRVGNYPGRIEAEAMKLDGYTVADITPWETASGGKAVVCRAEKCSATVTHSGAAGWYTLNVRYFDMPNAVSRFRLLVGEQVVAEWQADDRLPARKMDGAASTRRVISGIALRPGDEIRIEGKPAGTEAAAIDYIEVMPEQADQPKRP